MSSASRMQENRFELKYIIEEAKACAIRDFVRSYLEPDPFGKPELNGAYAIHSIYLDNSGLSLCNATLAGIKNRFKIRIRYYNDEPDAPVFFEIKRRVSDAILKRRAQVRRESVLPLLDGHWPEHKDLWTPGDPKAYDSLCQFCDLRDRINGQPQVIVSYLREAWVTPGNNAVRLTFDRGLSAEKWERNLSVAGLKAGVHPELNGTVLEMKFTDRFPDWMHNLASTFNLRRTSVPKYVHCVQAVKVGAPQIRRLGGIEVRV
jgi:hypothetical protein